MIQQLADSTSRIPNRQINCRLQTISMILAAIAIVASAFHFWPFDNSKVWQMLNPSNMAVVIWIVFLIGYWLYKPTQIDIASLLPHLSVFAYLSINILSVAFASDFSRAISFTLKLALIFIGAYALFSSAIYSKKSLRLVYNMATLAVTISVSSSLLAKLGFGVDNLGFFNSAYKYGTYSGTLAPLCATYLFTSSKSSNILWGICLVVAAFLTAGSLGAIAAISAGMITAFVLIKKRVAKLCILGSVVFGLALLFLMPTLASPLWTDIKLTEQDKTNLKQRYIEWQAEINLLKDRTITGTAAGCINDYRSNYYYRLPKLNTLQPFDQNGWLATGAETGILGLVCFCQIVFYYCKRTIAQVVNSRKKSTANRFASINFVGLVAACIANTFSSLHYNAVLVVFVLVIALISGTSRVLGET